MQMAPDTKLLDTREAAEFLGWHPEYVRRLSRRGAIPAIRLRRQWRFYLSTLKEWVASGCPSPSEQPNLFPPRDSG